MLYEYGIGVDQDKSKAVNLFELALDQLLDEQCNICHNGVELSYASAQWAIASIYELGIGVVQNKAKAVQWYQKAVYKNYARAQCSLGEMYYKGKGGLRSDKKEAARLYQLAAKQGLAQARINLGDMYYKGEGELKLDRREAIRLYRLAIDQGYFREQSKLEAIFADYTVPITSYKQCDKFFLKRHKDDPLKVFVESNSPNERVNLTTDEFRIALGRDPGKLKSIIFDENLIFPEDMSHAFGRRNLEDIVLLTPHITTASMTNMSFMFHSAHAFNEDISKWNVSKVTEYVLYVL